MIIFTLEELNELIIDEVNGFSKIIHLTWKNKEIPERWKRSWESWIKLHPDFVIMLWSDEENYKLIEKHYPDFLEKYQSYEYNIQRVDAVRVFYLYKYGGIYSDLDIAPRKSFETVLKNAKKNILLLSDAGNWEGLRVMMKGTLLGGYINSKARSSNMLMISKKGEDFWLKVRDKMLNPGIPWFGSITRHFYIMCTTGPFVVDSIMKENINEVEVLESRYFNPCTICDPKPCFGCSNSYVEMLDGSSWGSWDSQVITFLNCYGNIILAIIIFLIVLILIFIFVK